MDTRASDIRKLLAGVVVDDLKPAEAWYEIVLGRPPDAAPMPGLLEWHVAADAWLQVVDLQTIRDVQRDLTWGVAGASSVSFVVANLGSHLALFAKHGINVVSQFTTEAALKTATVRDPSGNFVTFVEEPVKS